MCVVFILISWKIKSCRCVDNNNQKGVWNDLSPQDPKYVIRQLETFEARFKLFVNYRDLHIFLLCSIYIKIFFVFQQKCGTIEMFLYSS